MSVFFGTHIDYTNMHIMIFVRIFSLYDLLRVTWDALRLMLFPFSLIGQATFWLGKLPRESIISLNKFSNESLTNFACFIEFCSWRMRLIISDSYILRHFMKYYYDLTISSRIFRTTNLRQELTGAILLILECKYQCYGYHYYRRNFEEFVMGSCRKNLRSNQKTNLGYHTLLENRWAGT